MRLSPVDSLRVLHVDDDPGIRDVTATFLEREIDRIAVETATAADEALARLDGTFDCVVSDYDMPGMDGIGFLEAVREEYPDLPFILYTGKGSEAVASDAISAGATDYLQKRAGTEQYELLANSIERAVDERRAVEALQSERDRLSVLFENATDAIAFYEFEGAEPVARMINPAFRETFGYEPGEALGESLDDLLVPPEYHDEGRSINRRVRSGEYVETKVIRRTVDGVREFRLRSVPIEPGEHGERGYVIYTDVTERKERERALRRERDRVAALFEHNPAAIAYCEFEGREPIVREVNSAFEATFGVDQAEVRGRSIDEVVVPPEYADEAGAISERVRAGEAVETAVVRRARDGERTFKLLSVPLTPGESVEGGFAIYTEVSGDATHSSR